MATLTAASANVPVWTLGDRLTKARISAGIKTAQDMAALMGVTEKTIRNWENGATRVTHATCIAWSSITGAPVEWIEGTMQDTDANIQRYSASNLLTVASSAA